MKRIIVATAAVVAAAGFAGQAHAAKFWLTNGRTMYAGTTGGGVSHSATISGLVSGQRSPAIAFDTHRRMYAAVNTGATSTIREITGFNTNAFAPTAGVVIGTLADATNSFDFRGTGSSERLIGTRNSAGSPQYFESTDSTYSAYSDIGAGTGFGSGASYPSSGYDRTTGTYWAVSAGTSGPARSIVSISTVTGVAVDTGLNLTFDGVGDQGAAAYGTIVLAGGDFVERTSTYYISFFSEGLGMAVIGTLDLTTGNFDEAVSFSLNGANEGTMGLAVVIPTPLAGGMGAAGIALIGVRRRRATI